MSWHHGRIVAFDVETTGVDVETARIVSASVAMCGGGEPMVERSWLADPGVEIPEEAAAVHGITTERARAEGRPPWDLVAQAVDALAVAAHENCAVVAFNARFDLTILDREARRHGVVPLVDRFDVLVVDPLVIDKWLDRFRRGPRNLTAQCEHYRVTLDAAHDAGADAVAAARLAWTLAERGEVKRRVRNAQEGRTLAALKRVWEAARYNLPLLHEAQSGWAYQQAESLRAYFRDKGDPAAASVRTEWPLVPYEAPTMQAAP